MTLELATHTVSIEGTPEPAVAEPPAEEVGTAQAVAAGAAVEDPLAELAVAMGAVAERAVVGEQVVLGERAIVGERVILGERALLTERAVLGESAAGESAAADESAVPTPGSPGATTTGLEQAVVAVLGLRSTGLPTAIALRGAGAKVIGIDRSTSRLERIRGGRSELSSTEQAQLRGHLAGGGFVLTERVDTLAAATYVLICVPACVERERRPDPEVLRRACAEVVAHARPGQTIVLTSTTYVGSTRELLVEPLAERGLRVGEDVFVAFAPERIDAGVPGHEQLQTPRVVGAVTERCHASASQLLLPLCKELRRVSTPEVAEMVKLYESTFRAVNIALAFEIAEACRIHGMDPMEVTDAAASKPFGFLAHYPSAGVGGHCIGVDPHHLAQSLRERGRPATITEEALRKIASRPRQVVWRAHELLVRSGVELSHARVLVVGASYKPGIADSHQAPAVEIISKLQAEGVHVEYHDPLVPELEVDGELMRGVDPDPRRSAAGFGPEDYALAILVTIQPGHDYGWLRRVPVVLDCTYRAHAGRQRFLP